MIALLVSKETICIMIQIVSTCLFSFSFSLPSVFPYIKFILNIISEVVLFLLTEFLELFTFLNVLIGKNYIIFPSHFSFQTFPDTLSPNHPTFLLTLKLLSNFLYYCYIYSCVYRNMSLCVCTNI